MAPSGITYLLGHNTDYNIHSTVNHTNCLVQGRLINNMFSLTLLILLITRSSKLGDTSQGARPVARAK